MPLGNYRWATTQRNQHDITVDTSAIEVMGHIAGGLHPTNLVRTLTTASAGLSISPDADVPVAAWISDAVSVRVCSYAVPGDAAPPLAAVDPFVNSSTEDLILGWAELVPTAVVPGAFGSFTIKYALPNGPIDTKTARKSPDHLTVGCCIAIKDPNDFWPRGDVGIAARWSYTVGMRILIADQI